MAQNKLPKLFRKPIDKKRYERRLASKIYLKPDRTFLDEITKTNDEGQIVLARELDDKERRRLSSLVKQAKKNKGAVSRGKVALLLVVVGLALAFSLIFKDMLVQRGAERLLEAVFVAESDFDGFRFRPLSGSVSFERLTVTDRDAPMTNLFEMATGRFDLNLWQLASGNVVIEDITVSALAFATPRERSGALPAARRAQAEAYEEDESLVDQLLSPEAFGLPADIDAEEFVEANLAALTTPDRVDELIEQSESFVAETRARLEQLSERATATFAEVEQFAARDFSDVDSLEEALGFVEEANRVYRDANALRQEIEGEYASIESQAGQISSNVRALPSSVEDDFDQLIALLPDVPSSGGELVASVAEPFLRDALGSWYGRIEAGYGYLQRVAAIRESEDETTSQRIGRVVTFPTVQYPTFLLQDGFFSSTGDSEIEASVSQISSDQSINNAPTTIDFSSVSPDRSISVGALFDGRDDAPTALAVNFTVTDLPVAFSEGLDSLGFNELLADAEIAANYVVSQDTSGSATVLLTKVTLEGDSAESTIGSLVREILAARDVIEITVAFRFDEDGSLSLQESTTNLDEALAEVARERVTEALAAAERRIRSELEAYLDPYLEEAARAVGGVVDVETSASELLELARDREQAAQAARRAATQAVESIRQQAEDTVRDRAEDAIRERLPLPGF
ncbi:MAG: hypothetical protein ACLFP4_01790 [Spirochaetales bacterium]